MKFAMNMDFNPYDRVDLEFTLNYTWRGLNYKKGEIIREWLWMNAYPIVKVGGAVVKNKSL